MGDILFIGTAVALVIAIIAVTINTLKKNKEEFKDQ